MPLGHSFLMPKIHEDWTILPHGPLEEVEERLLTVTGDIPMPLGNFPRRMNVVALAGGRTAIFSAISLPEPEMARIEALGRPAILIVPNGGHRLDAKAWKKRYPGIKVLAPPGGREAVAKVVPVDLVSDELGDPNVHFQIVAGVEETESALLVRRKSGTTLILNDLLGHVRHPHGLGAKIMARLMGFGVHGPRIPRVMGRYIKDKKALAAQLREWAGIEGLKRILVSHGEPIVEDPAGVLRGIAKGLEG